METDRQTVSHSARDRQIDKHGDGQSAKEPETGRQAWRQRDRQSASQHRQTDRKPTNQRQAHRQAWRQTDRHLVSQSARDRQTDKHGDRVAGQPEIGRLTDRQARRQSQQASQR